MPMKDIFHRDDLLEEYDEDLEMIAHVVGIFERDCDARMERIRDSIDNGDHHTLMQEAHALKGGTGNFFAVASYGLAGELESMGRDGNCENAESVFQSLMTALSELRAALRELVGE